MKTKVCATVAREAIAKPWNALGIFQAEDSVISRVPEHYKKFFYEWKVAPRSPVHYIPEQGMFKKLPSGEVQPIQNVRIPTLQPKELHKGIWGGEAIVKGFLKKNPTKRRMPTYWVPTLKSTVVYSEILDRYMKVTVTERALNLIDQHYGFDSYILKTPPADLMSELALKIRREMLLALCRGTLYPDNPTKREEIFNKYKEHMIPEEEAEWFGLTPKEAVVKQKNLEEAANPVQPLKHAFRKEFLEHLEAKKLEKENEEKIQQKESSTASSLPDFH